MSGRICSVDGCGEPHRALGFCTMHYSRWRRHGNPSVVKAGGRPRKRPHGSETRYSAGCRCARCRRAHADAALVRRRRRGARPHRPAGPLRTLIRCLVDFGVPEQRVATAMGDGRNGSLRVLRSESAEAATADMAERLHWGLWRAHGPFRRHCRCDVPDEVLASLEAA